MIIDIKIPSPGESISEVVLANWFVGNGDIVRKDQEIGEVESEKATLPLIAEQAGKIELLASAGDTLKVGAAACRIDTSVKPEAARDAGAADEPAPVPVQVKQEDKSPGESESKPRDEKLEGEIRVTPVARKMMQEAGISVDDIIKGLRKISSAEVKAVMTSAHGLPEAGSIRTEATRVAERIPMSQLRKKISQRLVAVKNETAMLTTFNEADMTGIMNLRKTYQDRFVEKHGIKLGFMSFFTRAVTLALEKFPNVNSYLEGDEIVSPKYFDIGIAVQTDKGLMVPVVRNAETLGFAEIEMQIADLAGRARKNRIAMDELSGGTFTITNGGIFGSMLSTPILNPPQSAILGMHNIVDRPVAINGKVEIRPMMYLALSYDHRVIDGRDSVGFLKTVKGFVEDPISMLLGGSEPGTMLLGL